MEAAKVIASMGYQFPQTFQDSARKAISQVRYYQEDVGSREESSPEQLFMAGIDSKMAVQAEEDNHNQQKEDSERSNSGLPFNIQINEPLSNDLIPSDEKNEEEGQKSE